MSMIIDVEIAAALASAIATAIGAAGASWRTKSGSTEVTDQGLSHIEKRLKELKDYLIAQESIEKRNQWAGGFLTIGQYIIGGILATSFIQETLSKEIIGFLGVLVLVSQIIHQKFRPDLRVASARSRVIRLKKLLRYANDQHDRVKIEYEKDSPEFKMAEHSIATSISVQIGEVEESEQKDTSNFETLQYNDGPKKTK